MTEPQTLIDTRPEGSLLLEAVMLAEWHKVAFLAKAAQDAGHRVQMIAVCQQRPQEPEPTYYQFVKVE